MAQSPSATPEEINRQTPDELLYHAIQIGNLSEVAKQLKRGANINCRDHESLTPLLLALILKRSEIAFFLLNRGCNCKIAITEDPCKGFTPLHIACWQGEYGIIYRLIYHFNADCNAKADDGALPIHLAFVQHESYRLNSPVTQLLEKGADPNAALSKLNFERYYGADGNIRWTGEFGEKIPLIALAISQKIHLELVDDFIKYGAKVNLKNRDNVTLLMMAASGRYHSIVSDIIPKLSKEEINCRDNFGYSAVHYLVHPSLFGKYRYNMDQLDFSSKFAKKRMLVDLEKAGADLNARVNGDPKTLLMNVVAYRALDELADFFDPSYKISPDCKPLYYSTIPDHVDQTLKYYSENSTGSDEQNFHHNQDHLDFAPTITIEDLQRIQDSKIETIKAFVCVLLRRKSMKLPIANEELNIINVILEKEIIAKEYYEMRKNYSGRIELKWFDKYITYGNKKKSFAEITYLSDRQLKKLARNELFYKAFLAQEFNRDSECWCYFVSRFNEIAIRPQLLKKFKKISLFVIRTFYLPYDCLLNILCYLDNKDLDSFIDSFLT